MTRNIPTVSDALSKLHSRYLKGQYLGLFAERRMNGKFRDAATVC